MRPILFGVMAYLFGCYSSYEIKYARVEYAECYTTGGILSGLQCRIILDNGERISSNHAVLIGDQLCKRAGERWEFCK